MTLIDAKTVHSWLDTMQQDLQPVVSHCDDVVMIGIQSGGVIVGQHLHQQLNLNAPLGELNIAFYRDDFSTLGLHPVVGPSNVPFDIDGKHVLLVDDVLSTGRTVRAAMNEIFDYGRPARITLAVLVQRTGHELPIRADVVGHSVDIPDHFHVELHVNNMTVTIGERQP